MRKDPYSNKNGNPAAPTSASAEIVTNYFGSNPPVRIEITYRNGEKEIFKGEEIDANNNVLKALGNLRPIRRFWTDTKSAKRAWSTDDELLEIASQLGTHTTKVTTAEKAAEIAAKLKLTAKWFVVGKDGEPLKDANGVWTEATPPAAPAAPAPAAPATP